MKSLLMLSFLICLIGALPILADPVGSAPPSGPTLPAPSPGPNDPIIGGPPNSNNCYPFGCAYNGDYQNVYTHSAFSGPITITDLEFFNTQINSGATSMNSGTWTISLSSTTADHNTLSPVFANNLGADNKVVFSGNLAQAWTFGDTLTIHLSTPFTYDPTTGLNLLMDVNSSGVTAPGGFLYFDAASNAALGRVYCYGCSGTGSVNSDYGLVTGFNEAAATPEPAHTALALMGLLGGLALLRRKLASSR